MLSPPVIAPCCGSNGLINNGCKRIWRRGRSGWNLTLATGRLIRHTRKECSILLPVSSNSKMILGIRIKDNFRTGVGHITQPTKVKAPESMLILKKTSNNYCTGVFLQAYACTGRYETGGQRVGLRRKMCADCSRLRRPSPHWCRSIKPAPEFGPGNL